MATRALVLAAMLTFTMTLEVDFGEVSAFGSCEAQSPPSGLYLNLSEMRNYHYDCLTGSLTPAGTASSSCDKIGDYALISGVCVTAKYVGDNNGGAVYVEYFVRMVGQYEHGEGYWHGHGSSWGTDCPDQASECRPISVGLGAGLGVTHLYETHQIQASCPAGDGFTVGGHLAIWGTSGDLDEDHTTNDNACWII